MAHLAEPLRMRELAKLVTDTPLCSTIPARRRGTKLAKVLDAKRQ